jgi:hypothetical protein
MKQSDKVAGLGVKPGNVRAFKSIAMGTRQGEIAVHGFASVLPGKNMIDLERKRESKLRNEAILHRSRARFQTVRESCRFTVE